MNTSRKPGSSRLALPKLSRHMGRRPNHDRRLANRKVVDLQAEMGLGFNGTLEPVAVREISEQSLYVLAEQRPRLGSDVQIYLNITHPVSGGSRRVCYTATVRRIDEFEGQTACAIAAIIHGCEVLAELAPPKPAATEPAEAGNAEEVNDSLPSRALAIKEGQDREKPPEDFVNMGTIRCDGCGEEFSIYHHPASADATFAGHQAYWFERTLATNHKSNAIHADRTELPE